MSAPSLPSPSSATSALEAARLSAESAADEARAVAEEFRRERARRKRTIEILVGFTAPPIVGIVILVLVFAGRASDAVIESPAATSTALIVAALLLLVPPVLFALSPERYAEHQTDVERRLRELLSGSDKSISSETQSRE